jgi:hypothetical protein
VASLKSGILPPPPSRPSVPFHVAADTRRAPADDGRKAATSSESAPASQGIGSGQVDAVSDYDLVSELPLSHALQLAVRRAEKKALDDE